MGDVGRKGFQEERKKRRMRFWEEEDEGGGGRKKGEGWGLLVCSLHGESTIPNSTR